MEAESGVGGSKATAAIPRTLPASIPHLGTSPASGGRVYLQGESKGMWPLFYLPKWVAVRLDCVIARTGLSAPGSTPTITLLLHTMTLGGTPCPRGQPALPATYSVQTYVNCMEETDLGKLTGVPWQREGESQLCTNSPPIHALSNPTSKNLLSA